MENTHGLRIILGSASPARKKILQEMGYEFDVLPAGIDEKAIRSDDPRKLVFDACIRKSRGASSLILSLFCEHDILKKGIVNKLKFLYAKNTYSRRRSGDF